MGAKRYLDQAKRCKSRRKDEFVNTSCTQLALALVFHNVNCPPSLRFQLVIICPASLLVNLERLSFAVQFSVTSPPTNHYLRAYLDTTIVVDSLCHRLNL